MSLPKFVIRLDKVASSTYSFFAQSKKLPAITNNDKRITNNQTGFALLPLIVLLLVGIAAGTLLIQNGLNFLPKAADIQIPSPDDKTANPWGVGLNRAVDKNLCPGQCNNSEKPICYKFLPYYPAENNAEFACNGYVTKTNSALTGYTILSVPLGECRGVCSVNQKCILAYSPGAPPAQSSYNYVCAEKDVPEGPVSPAAALTTEYCILEGIKESGSDTDVVIKKNQTWAGCDTQKNKVLYLCKGNNELSVDIKERNAAECQITTTAPAAHSAASGKSPSISDKQCTQRQLDLTKCSSNADEAKKLCVVDHAGFAFCMLPESAKDGDDCTKPYQDACKSEDNSKCIVIDRIQRCIRTACLSKEVTHCSDGGKCTTADKTISGTKYTYTYCGPASGSAPAAGAPATAPRPASGAGTQAAAGTGNAVRQDMVTAECGYTRDGLPIPCYKVGVFTSEDEVKATKAWAGIAAKRYDDSQKILNAVKDSVNEQVRQAAAAAQKKLDLAKAAADACMKQ